VVITRPTPCFIFSLPVGQAFQFNGGKREEGCVS
jgi:hypothetical protein